MLPAIDMVNHSSDADRRNCKLDLQRPKAASSDAATGSSQGSFVMSAGARPFVCIGKWLVLYIQGPANPLSINECCLRMPFSITGTCCPAALPMPACRSHWQVVLSLQRSTSDPQEMHGHTSIPASLNKLCRTCYLSEPDAFAPIHHLIASRLMSALMCSQGHSCW